MIQYHSLISKLAWREGLCFFAFYKSTVFLLFPVGGNNLFFALQQHLLEKPEKCYLYESDSLSRDTIDCHLPKECQLNCIWLQRNSTAILLLVPSLGERQRLKWWYTVEAQFKI